MRVFITGIGGFIGQHLSHYLEEEGHDVYGTYHSPTTEMQLSGTKTTFECDVRDRDKLDDIIKEIKPQHIYHLAAQSLPTVSLEDPKYTLETNIIGTLNVLESARINCEKSILFLACSSAEYGFVKQSEVPVSEKHSLLPLHPYGISKLATDMLGYVYSKTYNSRVIRARIFNTTGPMKRNDVCSDFISQVAKINLSMTEPVIFVGNLDAERAITDARDIVRAFRMSMLSPELFGEAVNFSGSKVYSIREILDCALSFSEKNIEIKIDEKLLRPKDEPIIYGDSTKLKKATNWEQVIDIEKTLNDMYNFWFEEYSTKNNV